jgi:hypothetical protein
LIGVTLLIEDSTDVVACLAFPRAAPLCFGVPVWTAADGFAGVEVHLVVRDTAEPALARRLMSEAGLELSLDCSVTGAATPFDATLDIDPAALRRHFASLRSPAGFLSWSQVVAETERLIADGALMVRTKPVGLDPAVVATAVARRLVDRFMRAERFPQRAILAPTMRAAWFRVTEGSDDIRHERLTLTEFDLETRALSVMAHLRSMPEALFHGLDGAYEEMPLDIRLRLADKGVAVGAVPSLADLAANGTWIPLT